MAREPRVTPGARPTSVQWTLAGGHAVAAAGCAVVLLAVAASAVPHAPADVWARLGALAAACVAAAAILGFVVGRQVKRRIGDLARAMTVLAAGGLGYRSAVSGEDEIGYLEVQFNAMAERLQRQVTDLHRLAEENAQLAREAGRAATLEERQRLARELHDAVSQALFSVVLLAAACRRHLPDGADNATRLLAELEETAAGAQREMRALILQLRPVELSGRTLAEALEDLLRDLRQRHGITADLSVDLPVALRPAHEDALFRIAQEAVANTLRHAGAAHVRVRLTADGDAAGLEVEDDGQGFDPRQETATASYGLSSMRERAEALGGGLVLLSAPGEGTRVRVTIPRGVKGEAR